MSWLSGNLCRARHQHLGVSPGCPWAQGLHMSSSTCPGGAGMLQGWHPGMPARGREGHLVCQSLEYQHLPYSLNSPGIFSPALMWRPLTALQCPHSTRCTELCVLWCPVSSKAFKPSRKKFSISLLAQTRGLYTCSAFPHFLMRCVQGILDEYGIHTLCVMWNSWTPQHMDGYHEIFVCGQLSISPWSLERLGENNLTTAVSVLHLSSGIHWFSGEVKYFSGMFLAYHSRSLTQ